MRPATRAPRSPGACTISRSAGVPAVAPVPGPAVPVSSVPGPAVPVGSVPGPAAGAATVPVTSVPDAGVTSVPTTGGASRRTRTAATASSTVAATPYATSQIGASRAAAPPAWASDGTSIGARLPVPFLPAGPDVAAGGGEHAVPTRCCSVCGRSATMHTLRTRGDQWSITTR